VVQRVREASVAVAGVEIARMGEGLLALFKGRVLDGQVPEQLGLMLPVAGLARQGQRELAVVGGLPGEEVPSPAVHQAPRTSSSSSDHRP